MRAPLIRLSCLLSLLIAASAHAITLTFDDLTTDAFASVPNGYGGLNWQNVSVYNSPTNNGFRYGAVSGQYVANNDFGYEATISASLFDFTSVYLTAGWNDG